VAIFFLKDFAEIKRGRRGDKARGDKEKAADIPHPTFFIFF